MGEWTDGSVAGSFTAVTLSPSFLPFPILNFLPPLFSFHLSFASSLNFHPLLHIIELLLLLIQKWEERVKLYLFTRLIEKSNLN